MSMISPYMSGMGYADLAYGGAAMSSMYHPYGSMARYGYNSYSRPWYSSLYGGYGGYGYGGGYGMGYSGYRWPIAY